MNKLIGAIYGILEDRIIHLSTDEEIQMIKNQVDDIINIQEESHNSSHLAWAMFFLGAGISGLFTLASGDSSYFTLIASLSFCALVLGAYFLWNWKVDRKKEKALLQSKKEQLYSLFEKIEGRVPQDAKATNEYDTLVEEETLDLNRMGE